MNTRTMVAKGPKLRLALAGSLLGLLSTTALPVAADAPVITNEVIRVTNPIPADFSCTGFNVLATFTVERRNISFYENGTLVQQMRHIDFEGTLYNAGTGYSVPYDGNWTRTEDFVEHTVTYTGKRFRVQIPGQGVLALEVGRAVFDFSDNPPQVIFEAGQHEFNTQLCEVLNP